MFFIMYDNRKKKGKKKSLDTNSCAWIKDKSNEEENLYTSLIGTIYYRKFYVTLKTHVHEC